MEIEIEDCKRGDVLKASDRDRNAGYHCIIFYEEYDGNDFVGCMLTHKESQKNAQMNESHFEKIRDDGNSYEFQYDNTKIVIGKLRKFGIWKPFYKIGELTKSGIEFMENTIDDLKLEEWDEYKRRTRHIAD